MDAFQIADRIHRNLTWSAAFGSEGPCSQTKQSPDVWRHIKAIWEQPDDVFVPHVYLILLGRPADREAQTAARTLLAAGAPRSALVRRLTLCAEAQTSNQDVAWLRHLNALEVNATWQRILALWEQSDDAFVAGLYPVLLGRPADAEGAAPLCNALAGGLSRAAVVRSLALSAEGRAIAADAPDLLRCLNAKEAEAVWGRLRSLWNAANKVFVEGLYPILLGRRTDAGSAKAMRYALAAGAPRSSVVRRIALSEEARALGLDVSWLPGLEQLEPDAVWLRVQALWPLPDEPFVMGLFHALLGRSAAMGEMSALCAALASGSPRAVVVRDLVESDEARGYGLSAPWLPMLHDLPTNAASRSYPFSFHSLKFAFRRWLAGWKVTVPAPPPNANRQPDATSEDALQTLTQ